MNVEPMARISLLREPGPALADGIKKNRQEHKEAQHAELHTDSAAGPEQYVFRGEGPLCCIQRVVIKSVRRQGEKQRDGGPIQHDQPDLVPSRLSCGRHDRSGGNCGICAYGFCAMTSSVLTENSL